MDMLVFTFLVAISVIISAGVSLAIIGPNITGIGSACINVICGVPLAYIVFVTPAFAKKFPGHLRFFLPAFIVPLVASVMIGLTIYDRNPDVMFKRLLSDPIPAGVTNIKSYENSGGFDVEYNLAFDTTPQAIDYLISKNKLTLDNGDSNFNRNLIPLKYFSDVKPQQDWSFYSRFDKEHENWWFLWVNADKTTVLFQFIGG